MAAGPLVIKETQHAERGVVLRLVGALDVATVPLARRTLDGVRSRGTPVRVDLRELSLLDSTGVGFLVAAQRGAAADGDAVDFIAPSGHAARIIARMQLDRFLRFVDASEPGRAA